MVFNSISFYFLKRSAEDPSETPQPPPRGKTPEDVGKPSSPAEAPTELSTPVLTPLLPPSTPSPPRDPGQKPVLPKRRPPPLRPGWTGLPFLPGSTGVIMETGEAGPPGRMGVSGRGLPRGVDGQTGQRPIPSAEGYAGAPGKCTPGIGRLLRGSVGHGSSQQGTASRLTCPKMPQCPGHRTSHLELHPGLYYLCHPGSSLILPAGSALENQTCTGSLGSSKEEHTTKRVGWKVWLQP